MCNYCLGTGVKIVEGTKCSCVRPKNAYFANKGKKKKQDDTLTSGHKHTNDKFLYETAKSIWFECGCGHTFKIEA